MSVIHQEGVDWHRAYIVAALKVKGLTVAGLSVQNQLSEYTLRNALDKPWPKGERIIASALGLQPEDIWPSRYQQKSR